MIFNIMVILYQEIVSTDHNNQFAVVSEGKLLDVKLLEVGPRLGP